MIRQLTGQAKAPEPVRMRKVTVDPLDPLPMLLKTLADWSNDLTTLQTDLQADLQPHHAPPLPCPQPRPHRHG